MHRRKVPELLAHLTMEGAMILGNLTLAAIPILVLSSLAAGPSCAQQVANIDQMLDIHTLVGALVVEVDPDGAAARAGLSAGDVLASVDGQTVRDFRTLESFVSALRESAMLKGAITEVWHLDRASGALNPTSLKLKLPARVGERFGMVLIPVLFVREVRAGSAAESSGIRAWDSIEKIGGQRLADVARFNDFDELVLNHRIEGKVQLTIGHWKPSESTDQKQVLEGLRETTLPVSAN
jgi:S1-C subfamily serine protease